MAEIECHVLLTHSDFIMQNHRVHDVSVMPGVTFLDIVYRTLIAAGLDHRRAVIRDVLFTEAIATKDGFDREIRISVDEPRDAVQAIRAESRWTADERPLSPWRENFRAELAYTDDPLPAPIDVAALKAGAVRRGDMEELYGRARAEDIRHGTPMKCFGTLHRGTDYLLAELRLDETAGDHEDGFHLHPAKLDASTLAGLGQTQASGEEPFIPVYIREFRAPERLGGAFYMYAPQPETLAPSGDVISNDYALYDERGRFLAGFVGLACKRIRFPGLITKLLEVPAEAATPHTIPEPALGTAPAPAPRTAAQVIPGTASEPVPGTAFESAPGTAAQAVSGTVSESAPGTAAQAVPEADVRTNPLGASQPDIQEVPRGETATRQDLVAHLRSMTAELLGRNPARIATDVGFYDLGLDSVTLLRMSEDLEDLVGSKLYPTLLFEYSDIDSLAEHLSAAYDIRPPAREAAPAPVLDPAPASESAEHETGDVTTRCYRDLWVPQEAGPARPDGGDVVVVGAASDLNDALRRSLAATGSRLVQVEPGTEFEVLGEAAYRLDPRSPEQAGRLIDDLSGRAEPPRDFVVLASRTILAGEAVPPREPSPRSARSSLPATMSSAGASRSGRWPTPWPAGIRRAATR